MPVVDLRVDRSLLCPNFDGYKLSFDPVPVIQQDLLATPPLKLLPHSDQYSLLHAEAFGRHNMLCPDPWLRENCYYVNKSRQVVLCSYDGQDGRPRQQRVVHTVEEKDRGDGYQQSGGAYNYTLRFVSEKYCVLCDGITMYYLFDTGDRSRASSTASWQLLTSTQINQESANRGFVLYDARLDVIQERKQISLLAGHVGRRVSPRSDHADTFFMDLTWGCWTQQPMPSDAWSYSVREELDTPGSIYYCAFEPRAESVVFSTNRDLLTKSQRAAAVSAAAQPAAQNGEDVEIAATPPYTWTQTDEDVLIRFRLPAGATRNDFNIRSTSHQLEVECLAEILLTGALYANVDSDLTTWTIEADSLQLTLVKELQQSWPHLLSDDESAPPEGEANVDPLPDRSLPIPNLEDPIEDCDLGLPDVDVKLVRFNLEAREITHTIFLGSTPPLFTTSLRAGFPAAFATRQGVDASLWLQVFQPAKPTEWTVRHEGNLHAFAYVQASKEQRKFTDCCPDLDYAVICEGLRHVLIYKSRYDSAGGLRKRNGPQVVIGKQHMVSISDEVGEILGLSTARNVITILTEKAVLYLQV
ncbi:nudC domain-containing protein 1 [Drosophila persimilis]|uniref:nudC domain-containing protein 1 n=1 Tax=Drosophila persimilis TaxID=7234 RepID=UPI000F07F23E|nr:nudC domain-containing protein 1 [Drosophila persimilis]